MRYCQFVMGPAGSGKSTYCATIAEHCEVIRRSVHVLNLDPAAEHFNYPVSWDIRSVISVDDVAQTLGFGPNGGLVYYLEFLTANLQTLDDVIGDYADDYLIFDCPGQIELYTHIPVMRRVIEHLQSRDYRCAAVYLLDSQFLDDPGKYFAGVLSAMSTMVALELPHVNVMSKMDLVHDPDRKKELESYLHPDPQYILQVLDQRTVARQRALNRALATLIEDYSLVQFIPLNRDDEDSIMTLMHFVDHCLQYGEDEDVQIPKDVEEEEGEEGEVH